MKVLMMTSRADIGGGPKYVYDLIQSIKDEVEVYTATPDDEPFFNKYKELSKDIYLLPHRKFSFLIFIKLIVFLWRNEIKIIHSHGRGAGVYSRLLGLFGFKVVHTFHGVHFNHSLKGKIVLFIEKILLPLGNIYIFCSGDEKEEAFKWGLVPKNFQVILNSINLDHFTKISIKDEINTIGTIARFDPVKGFDYFFKNINFLNSKGFKGKFLIAGASLNDFEGLAIPYNVEILGEISAPNSFYQKIDLLVSHSLKEGMPLTVLEAMASGVPCLLSNVPGHKYFINNDMALGFELTNDTDFYEKFFALQSRDDRFKLADFAYSKVSKNHSINNLMKKNLVIYKSL